MDFYRKLQYMITTMLCLAAFGASIAIAVKGDKDLREDRNHKDSKIDVNEKEEDINPAKDEFSIESTCSDAVIITYLIGAYIILHASFKRFVPDDSL